MLVQWRSKKSTRDRRSAPTVQLRQYGQHLAIVPPVPELESYLYSSRHKIEIVSGECVVKARPCTLLCHPTSGLGSAGLAVHAGFILIVASLLRDLGYRVQCIDEPRTPLAAPRIVPKFVTSSLNESLTRFINESDRGVIYYDEEHVQPLKLIAQAAYAFPAARIIVPLTRVADTFRVGRQLKKLLHEDIAIVNNRVHPVESTRIVVGTYANLGGGIGDLHNRDLLFALNPREMLANLWGQYTTACTDQGRLFAFQAIGESLTPFERDHIWMIFGSRRLELPREGQIVRSIHAAFLRIKGGPRIERNYEIYDLLRNGIWNHPVRNRRIARLATQLAAGRFQELPNPIRRSARRIRELRGSSKQARVGILAANVEHALQLGRRLTDWRLVTDTPVQVGGLDDRGRQLLRTARHLPMRTSEGIIVTQGALHTIRRVDILIRADGGVGGVPAQWAHYRDSHPLSLAPAVLIDFDDLHHPALRRRSQQRRRAYIDSRWELPAELPTELDRFLATRPKFGISS